MATKKIVLENLINKSKRDRETVKTCYSFYKKINDFFNVFYNIAQSKKTEILALVYFVEETYEISEEERKEVMKCYLDIDEIVKKAIKEAEAEGWVYYGEVSWKKLEKTA